LPVQNILQTTGIGSGTEEWKELKYAFPHRPTRNLKFAGTEHATDHWHSFRRWGARVCFFIWITFTVKNSNPAAEPHGSLQGCTVTPRKGFRRTVLDWGRYLASRLSSSWVLSFHKFWQGFIFGQIAAPKFFWHFGKLNFTQKNTDRRS
jgi:hypothetical protein